MSVYQRYTSTDENIQQSHMFQNDNNTNLPTERNIIDDDIIINPLSGRLELSKNSEFKSKSTEEWINIFPNAAYFAGFDEVLFGHVLIMIYENTVTGKICSVSLTKFGVTMYNDLILNPDSRFYPSCENLLPIHKDSKVRKSLAVTNLKNYNKLVNHPGSFDISRRWDETNAGSLASRMNLLVDKRPNEFGIKLLQMGLLSNHTVKSLLIDTVYNNSPSTTDEKIIQDNNKLVCLLGDQLDQLFDPLLEYSPETLENSYNVPNVSNYERPMVTSSDDIKNIISELFTIQSNFTMGLVSLLQNFIIPLRIHILSLTDNQGISKINHIFPPTIDEITRINCVLHDSLARAEPFGYVEIIKVFGMILPYFYKPFIRHEANLKNFKSRFNKFHDKYESQVFHNKNINPQNYSKSYIDSVITGSLLELPRLKLILMRLYDTISKEYELGNVRKRTPTDGSTDGGSPDEWSVINYYYNTAIGIIDAFGGEDNEISSGFNHERVTSRQRIFTPTGKLLTELAGNWPVELQYGWLTRKVIGIFELKNVKPKNQHFYDDEVLIIFSDHLLFLTIVDDNYYVKENLNDGSMNLRISDILMHSLVNEKPLPKLSSFPKMQVSHWCSINDVIVSSYKSFSFLTSSEENFLRFVDYTGEGFKGDPSECVKNYEILRDNNSGNFTTGNEIIELINKSKILYKNQPFHLFRSNSSNLHIYTTAHSASSYDEEHAKSQIVLMLNMPELMISHYFEMNKHLFLILTAAYTYDGDIQVIGFNRTGGTEINVILNESEFQCTLTDILKQFVNCYYNSFDAMTELMIDGVHKDLEYYLMTYQRFNGYEVREQMKTRVSSNNQLFHESVEEFVPEVDMIKHEDNNYEDQILPTAKEVPIKHKNKSKKRRSFFKRLFGIKSTPEKEEQVKYRELYRPTPKLERLKNTTPEPVPQNQSVPTPEIEPDLTKYDSEVETVQYFPDVETVGDYDDEGYESEDYPQPQMEDNDNEAIKGSQTNVVPMSQFDVNDNVKVDDSKPGFRELFDSSEDTLDYLKTRPGYDMKAPESVPKVEENQQQLSPEKVEAVGAKNLYMIPKLQIPRVVQKSQKAVSQKPTQETQVTTQPKYVVPQVQKIKPVHKEQHKSEPALNLKLTEKPLPAFKQQFNKPEPVAKSQPIPKPQPVAKQSVKNLKPVEVPQHSGKLDSTVNQQNSSQQARMASLDVTSNFEFPSPTKPNFNQSGVVNSIRAVEQDKLMSPSLENVYTQHNVDNDEEANWIQFSRESSLLSVDEQLKLKFPAMAHNLSFSASINSSLRGDANFANKIRSREVSAADSFRSQVIYFNSQIANRNDSCHSLSTASFVNEFSREIDFNFKSAQDPSSRKALQAMPVPTIEPAKLLRPEPIKLKPWSTPRQKHIESVFNKKESKRDVYDANEVPKRYSGMNSSEDEYYSIEGSPRRNEQTHTQHGSFSSENTIINELLQDTVIKDIDGKDNYVGQFDSIAYLSDVINGTANFTVD